MRKLAVFIALGLLLTGCDESSSDNAQPEAEQSQAQLKPFSGEINPDLQNSETKGRKLHEEEAIQQDKCHTEGFRILDNQKTAICNGVRMYVRSQAVASTYKRALKDINQAKENGNYKILPSGAIQYDFANKIGLELPMSQVPTANQEPVFFSCNVRLKLCNTLYLYKKNLEITYDPQTHWLEEDGGLQKIDKNYRKVVDEFIRDNPEFYTKKDKGE